MQIAVLDANVLFPMILRDTLLRIAAAGCFRAYWSDRILEEMTRNLVADKGMAPAKAETLRLMMEEAFPDAAVTGWEELEAAMQNDPKDRHVAAAAATIHANVIVTSNIRDFVPPPAEIAILTPDDFLAAIFTESPKPVLQVLEVQAAGYRRPALTVAGLVERLAINAPKFAALVLKSL